MSDLKIGIPPETILKDVRTVKPRFRDEKPAVEAPKLIIVGGEPPEPPVILDAMGQPMDSLNWNDYLEWRKTKCRPYDYEYGPQMATSVLLVDDAFAKTTDMTKLRALEEIDQATLEFVGEVAELGELLVNYGPTVFLETSEYRAKLIDEIGDIFFCGAWTLDAWGKNPLKETDDLEIARFSDDATPAQIAQALGEHGDEALNNPRFMHFFTGQITSSLFVMQVQAGLLCNSFKKLKYQRRRQDVNVQVNRVATVLITANVFLRMANSCVEEALKANMTKLNARYPDGYVSGQGGGIREGAGS